MAFVFSVSHTGLRLLAGARCTLVRFYPCTLTSGSRPSVVAELLWFFHILHSNLSLPSNYIAL